MLSSIFSFDTLEVRPKVSTPVWVALAIVAAARVALLAQPDAFLTVAELGAQQQYMAVEALHRLSDNPSPEVIIAGTSRLGALPPSCIAEAMGIPARQVANYSCAGNTFWRVLAFLRRNPDAAANLNVLVFDVLPFQLHRGPIVSESDPLFLALATDEERARIETPGDQLIAWSDRILPYRSERRRIIGWWERFSRLAGDERAAYEAYRAAPRFGTAPDPPGARLEFQKTAKETMRALAPQTRIAEMQVEALAELRALLPERTRLVLVWLPVRDDFRDYLETPEHGFAGLKSKLKSIEPGADLIWVDRAADWDMTGDDFTDIVHYTESGLEKTCDHLGDAVRALAAADSPD